MQKRIELYAKKHGMLEEQDIVITGVSGGADSICLLFVLLELKKTIGFEVVAVHVNHEIRGAEADRDQAFVERICREYNLPCITYRKNVELIARNRKQSMEEAGRDVRKEAFRDAKEKYGGTKIALAHHMNDNAETLLFHLARGTGIRGMVGIRPVNEDTIRPLLCVERKEIEQYLNEKGISYCTDQTNETDDYSRNRIRNHIIPYMEEAINRKTVSHMNRTMEYLSKACDYIEQEAETWYDKAVVCSDGRFFLEQKCMEKMPELMRAFVIRGVMQKAAGSEQDLLAVHTEDVADLFDKQVGKKICLPYGLEAVSVYGGVRIGHTSYMPLRGKEIWETSVQLPLSIEKGERTVCGTRVSWRVFNHEDGNFVLEEKTYTKWFHYDIIKSNVEIRTRREGDYITIDQNGNTKKLKKFFVDEKIPSEERSHILLVAEGSHILWIVGYRMSCAYQIHAHTKHILEIVINGGEENGRNS